MRSLTLGRVREIDVKVHPTFALVAVWVIYNWGIANDGGVLSVLYGFVLLLCVFSFVLLHEFGHSLMAQHYGIRVHDITLVPFGGIARLEQLPSRPRYEALIAIAGPAVNVGLVFALLPLMVLVGIFRGFDSVGDFFLDLDKVTPSGLIVYLFLTNIMLVIFNLLPAFPMDGGRLVRAGLTHLLGREQATKIAVGLGVIAAALIGGVGLWWGDFALPLIAIFIIVAAYGESRIVRLEESMRRLRVGQFALWDRGGLTPSDPLTFALRGGPRDAAVTEDGEVVGMIWRTELLSILNGGVGQRTVGDVMDRNVETVSIDDSVFDVQQQMQRSHRWAMPVIENGQYRGIFTADRLIHVYRYLNAQSPERRRIGEFAGALSGLFRAPGR
jgi:Zn-dependent protease